MYGSAPTHRPDGTLPRRRLRLVSAVLLVWAWSLASPSGLSAEETTSRESGRRPVLEKAQNQPAREIRWIHLSSSKGDLPIPTAGNQQTASLVADIDRDGINDFLITERSQPPAVVWFRRGPDGWTRYVVEVAALPIEAGSAVHDIDGDADLDVVFAGDYRSNKIWWWENPFPDYEEGTPWRRHLIKRTGGNKHHDQIFGDFDGDGAEELAFWNQGAGTLYLAEIPEDPRQAASWTLAPIYSYGQDGQMQQRGTYPTWKGVNEHEGLAKADIDGDGRLDFVGGGRWFKYLEGATYRENIIDASYPFTRSAAGQLVEGGRPEVVLVAGDGTAPLMLYQWREGTWQSHVLIEAVQDGHSLEILDFDGDGHLDIFNAEMRLGANPNAKIRILLGNGRGRFSTLEVATGYGSHESKIADLDGDGDYDILAKPYTWQAPRVDVWINDGWR